MELEALYEQFKSLSTVDKDEGGIDRETFEQCLGPLGLEKNLITERIFAFFDQDGDNIISFAEIVAGLSVLCKGNLDEKIECKFTYPKGDAKINLKHKRQMRSKDMIWMRTAIFHEMNYTECINHISTCQWNLCEMW